MRNNLWVLGLVVLGLVVGAGVLLSGRNAPVSAIKMEQPSSAAKLPEAAQPQLIDLGLAPELTNQVWVNTDHPLRLADLRGKVVLLEMWTFDCINCQHVVPSIREWYAKYAKDGLVVIGNHFPEFGEERDLGNLKAAVARMDIRYPVAQDNDGKTWNAYHNRYWPTAYLIDKQGHIRYIKIGEGDYALTEAAIQELLGEAN